MRIAGRWTFLAFFLSAIVGCYDAETPAPAAGVFIMSEQELSDLRTLDAELTPRATFELDMANPLHYRIVMAALARTGESAERSPELYRRLEAAHNDGNVALRGAEPPKATAMFTESDTPSPVDLNFIATFSKIPTSEGDPDHQATGLSSVVGGTEQSTILMELYTPPNGQVYATGSGSQYAQGVNFQVPVSGVQPDPSTTTRAQAIFIYTPHPAAAAEGSGTPVTLIVQDTVSVNPTAGCMQQPNYCVRDGQGNCIPDQYATTCTNQVPNTTPIKLCWSRGSQQECDYWNSTAHPTDFVFPMSGNAQFANQVVTPAFGAASIAIQNPTKGGGCNVYFQQGTVFDPTYWTASGNSIAWSFPAAAFPNTGDCIEYYNGTDAYLWMQASVALQGTGPGPPPVGALNFTSDRSQLGVPGVYIIPPLYIVQGCFAAGTRITLGDGESAMAIDDFDGNQDEHVLDGDGKVRLVGGTTEGTEPNKDMVRLRTDQGHDLLLTEGHPVVGADGVPVLAKNLKAGDRVKTLGGDATLTEVGREAYRGKVHNLVLAPAGEFHHLPPEQGSTFYAGGILTGDGQMQHYYASKELAVLSSDPDAVRRRLPKAWLTDFENHQQGTGAKPPSYP